MNGIEKIEKLNQLRNEIKEISNKRYPLNKENPLYLFLASFYRHNNKPYRAIERYDYIEEKTGIEIKNQEEWHDNLSPDVFDFMITIYTGIKNTVSDERILSSKELQNTLWDYGVAKNDEFKKTYGHSPLTYYKLHMLDEIEKKPKEVKAKFDKKKEEKNTGDQISMFK